MFRGEGANTLIFMKIMLDLIRMRVELDQV